MLIEFCGVGSSAEIKSRHACEDFWPGPPYKALNRYLVRHCATRRPSAKWATSPGSEKATAGCGFRLGSRPPHHRRHTTPVLHDRQETPSNALAPRQRRTTNDDDNDDNDDDNDDH